MNNNNENTSNNEYRLNMNANQLKQKLKNVKNEKNKKQIIQNYVQQLYPFNRFFSPQLSLHNIQKVNRPLEQKNTRQTKYFTEKDYQSSLQDITQFGQSVPDSFKKNIRVVFYHKKNADGYVAAYTAWNYITNGGIDVPDDLVFIGLQPNIQKVGIAPDVEKQFHLIQNHFVLMTDLHYNDETIQALSQNCKGLLYIDEHGHESVQSNSNKKRNYYYFKGLEKVHCSSVLTFKVFYPSLPIPQTYQYIDNNDSKLFMPYLPFPNEFNVALYIRIIRNTVLEKRKKLNDPTPGGGFSQLHLLFEGDRPELLIIIGKYMNEQRENFKFECAQKAYYVKILGYSFAILNFFVPNFKTVGRQMITDARQAGIHVDFAMTWVYIHHTGEYHLQIQDDYVQSRVPLSQLYQQLVNWIESRHLGKVVRGHAKGHIINMFVKSDTPKLIHGLITPPSSSSSSSFQRLGNPRNFHK